MLATMKQPAMSLPPDTVKPFAVLPSDTVKNMAGNVTPPRTTGNNSDVTLTPTLPASPQAAAFQRAGEYTVNNASGIPDISIPLYELDHHGYKIPIVLRYMPTPLRRGYNYDVTGHGWSLSLGSCVSRTIVSLPDEKKRFMLDLHPIDRTLHVNPDAQQLSQYIEACNFEHDRFNVTLPNGESFGFFIVNYNGNISVLSAKKGYDIQFDWPNQGWDINSFTITDPSGVQYLFDIVERSLNPSPQTNLEEVAWYLSRITIPHVSQPVFFTYGRGITQSGGNNGTEPMLTMKRLWSIPQYSPSGNLRFYYSHIDTWTHYQTKLLTKISFGSTTADFNYNNPNDTTYKNLTSFTISDSARIVRKYTFDYDYHYPYGTVALLSKLTITGLENTDDKLVYRFQNHSVNGIFGTDHWGYGNSVGAGDHSYNLRQIANMNYYTEYTETPLYPQGLPFTLLSLAPGEDTHRQKLKLLQDMTGADPRQPAPPKSHGILSAIIYPTGGKTEFVFENHRFVTATDANGDYVATKRNRRITNAGGFRIKSITNYTSDWQVSDVKEYRYGPTKREVLASNLNLPVEAGTGMDEHIGYGEPVVDPNIFTYTKITSSPDYQLVGSVQNVLTGDFTVYTFPSEQWILQEPGNHGYQFSFSPLHFRSLVQGREPVVYSQITEYHGQIGENMALQNASGKTVSEYEIYNMSATGSDSVYGVPLRRVGNLLLVDDHIYKRDYLKKKTDYSFYTSNSWPTTIRTETYNYSLNQAIVTGYSLDNYYDPEWRVSDGYLGGNPVIQLGTLGIYASAGSYNITGKTVTQDRVTTTESIGYNTYGLVSSRSFTGAKPHITTYTYPSSNGSQMEQRLYNMHMYSSVLSSHTQATGTSARDVSGYKIDYDTCNLPNILYKLSVVNGVSNGFEEEMHVRSYSPNGNPTEVVDRSGMHTVYVWGYDDRYLVAEVKNDSLVTVNSVLSGSPNVSVLRTHPSLANAMVTTWTYQPLVGVTSQTDPAGVTTYYDYDGLGRLKEVYRYTDNNAATGSKEILSQYDYHTITQ